MDTEEKAKAYEMALEAARKELGVDRKEWKVVQQVLCNIFHELTESEESEDERIRKALIKLMTVAGERYVMSATGFEKERLLAYLEKQKEQKPAGKQDYSGLNDLERAIHRGFLTAGMDNVPVTVIKETAKECLAQMKPAEWSKEDEEMLTELLLTIEPSDNYDEMRNWLLLKLKSLLLQGSKDSLQTHWKPSEDDKQYFDNLVVMFEKSLRDNRCYFTSYDVDWLKSKLNGNSGK